MEPLNSNTDWIALERQGWEALSSSPGDAKAFYDALLDDDVHMLFPGEIHLVGKAQVLEMMGGAPWRSFEIAEARVVALSDTAQSVTYKVSARREGAEPYRALICSSYALRPEGWRLVIHQHTPV